MSRSKRRTPIMGIATLPSEKRDKQLANRALRRSVHVMVDGHDLEKVSLPLLREVSNVGAMAKDGKSWYGSENFAGFLLKMMRK